MENILQGSIATLYGFHISLLEVKHGSLGDSNVMWKKPGQ